MSAPRSIAWSLGGQLATTAASMVSTVVLGRILTPTDFGAFAFAAVIYSVVQWLLQMGMGQYILREAELGREKLDGAFAIVCAQGLASSLIVVLLAPVAGWFSNFAAIGWVTLSVAMVPLLGAPEGICDALWLRQGRYASIAMLQVAKAAVQSLVSIAAQFLFHWGAYALAAGLIAGSLASFVVSVASLVVTNRARPVTTREQWGVLRGFGGRSFALTLAQIGSLRAPDLLIGRLLSVPILGHYSRATAAIDVFGRTMSGSIVRATAPTFYREVNEGRALDGAVGSFCDVLLFFVWPSVAGIAILAVPLIHLLYGPQWDVAARALPLLCLSFAIDAARTGGMETLLIRDRLGLNARLETVHAVYAIAFVISAAPWGLTAVLWARVADAVLTLLLYFGVMHRLGGLPVRALPRIFGVNALLAGAAALPPFLLLDHWGWPGQLDFARYVLAIGGGVLAWGVVLVAIRHPSVAHARAIVARRLGGPLAA